MKSRKRIEFSVEKSRLASEAFWLWFTGVAGRLAADLDNDEILTELDRRVRELGPLTWEVGPGLQEPNFLAISPAGQRKLLELTDEIVRDAPSLPAWEFHSAKPAKRWTIRFSIEGSDGISHLIDGVEWRYILLRYPDGMFDIVILAPNLPADARIEEQAGAIVVKGQLGERLTLEHVRQIEIVRSLGPENERKSSSISDLPAHFSSLVSANTSGT